MSNHHSDLQVVTAEDYPKYVVLAPDKSLTSQQYFSSEKVAVEASVGQVSEQSQPVPQRRRKICGLSRWMFWIICAVAVVVVVAAAVGGGVAASLSSKSTSREATGSNTAIATATSFTNTVASQLSTQSGTPTTQTSTATLSTTTVIGPSGTLLVDCPSSNDTLYKPSSSTQLFRKLCGDSLLNINGYGTSITEQVSTLDDCISQCAGYNTQYALDIAQGTKNLCNAACWRSTAVDTSGWCYGFTTSNSTGTFQRNGDTRCNSAALINQ